MTRFQLILNRFLIGWGLFCAACVIVLGIAIAYQFGPGKVSTKTASKHDVRFVLNWCGLGEERAEEVLNSYISARSFTGDHIDTHAIRISHVELSELTQNSSGEGWFRGDKVPDVVDSALNFVGQWIPSEDFPWFPKQQELRSSKIYIYPWSIYFHGIQPAAVKLIFVRPEDNMVFYFGAKT